MGYYTVDESEFTVDDFKSLLVVDEAINEKLPQYAVGTKVDTAEMVKKIDLSFTPANYPNTDSFSAIHYLYAASNSEGDMFAQSSLLEISHEYWGIKSGKYNAINATQSAIWALLIDAGAPDNIKYSDGETDADAQAISEYLLSSALAKQIYNYANIGITFPDVKTPTVSNSNPEFVKQNNGQYVTSEITVTGNGTLDITLPQGISIYYDNKVQDHIESGKAFRLISDTKPTDNGTISVKATGQVVHSDVFFFTEVQPVSRLRTLTITHQNLMAINRKVSVAKTSFNYKVTDTKKTVETGAYDYSLFWIILTIIPLTVGSALVLKKEYN